MAPSLVLLAAGVGRRYGGPKQLDPVGPGGATLVDYAAFDAREAGFEHVVLVVRSEIEEAVRAVATRGLARHLRVDYALQEAALPTGFRSPARRAKPWGTGHAVVAAAPFLDGPFAVLNADDFYGAGTYRILADWLGRPPPASEHARVAFALRTTLSPAGPVNRGVCRVDGEGFLREVREVLKIEADGDGARFPAPDGADVSVDGDTPVSLNFWGFSPEVLPAFEEAFEDFLAEHGSSTTAELFLPEVIQGLIDRKEARVRVLPGGGPWAGLTFPEDRPHLVAVLEERTSRGHYPLHLWD
jgi:hypothetical protein